MDEERREADGGAAFLAFCLWIEGAGRTRKGMLRAREAESIQEHSVLWRGVRACGAEGSGEGAKETGAAGREGAAGGTGWSGGRAGAGDWTERGEKGNGMEGEGVQLVGPPPAGPIHFVAVLGGSLLLREIGLGRWLYHVGFVY